MKYEVIQSPRASADLEAAALWIAKDSPQAALHWLDGISASILTLADFPLRCPLAPESRAFDIGIRQTHFGKRRWRYRILFTVRPGIVWVLHIRRGLRSPATKSEINEIYGADVDG